MKEQMDERQGRRGWGSWMDGWMDGGSGWKTGDSERSPGAAEVVGVAEEIVGLHPAPEDGVPLPVEEAHAGPGGGRGGGAGGCRKENWERGGGRTPATLNPKEASGVFGGVLQGH